MFFFVYLQTETILIAADSILRFKHIAYILLVTVLGFVPDAAAQRIVSMHIDSTHCIGDSLHVNAGYNTQNNVVVEHPSSSISHPQRTLLPDGTVCDSTIGTCTYRSPITFFAFDIAAVVTTTQSIDYVRLNMEHSWIGDILIALECPNGQFSSLLNTQAHDTGCGEDKFDSLLYWNTVFPNAGGSSYLGKPIDEESRYYPCDPNDTYNRPGTGWNYCWSENSNHQYAPHDGLIYRRENSISVPDTNNQYSYHATIDSTHIAADTHFYRPQQSFTSLIGCPLNGTWNIVVQDSWDADNGWLFDWELAFDSTLMVPAHIAMLSIDGGPVATLDDTTVALVPPTADTTLLYNLRVVISCGDTLDTTFTVHWLEPFFYSETDTLCQGDTARWTCLEFTTDTLHQIRTTRINGCDSTVDLSYTFMPSYSLHDTLPYCANEQFLYEGVDYGGPCTIVVPHQTQYGCDSTVTVHLITIDSAFHLQLQMSADSLEWSTDTMLYGCQPMTVWLRDTTLFERWRLWTFGDGDTLYQELTSFQDGTPFTHTYDSAGVYMLTLTAESIHGCVDSAVFRQNAVWVYETPVADFYWNPSEVVNHDPQTQLLNHSSPMDSLSFLWQISTGDGNDTSTERSPHYEWPPSSIGNMDVTLSAFWTHVIDDSLTLTCVDTTTHTVVIINEYLQFPNLVTPNGDGVNDRWVIVNLLECGLYSMNELWIYDHWGMLVYHAKNIHRTEDFWDPTPYPDGTYYYRFTAKSRYGLVRRQGTIEVLR